MSHGKPKDPPFEEDAARLAAEPGHGPDDFEGFDTGGATVEFARRYAASWLRSPAALRVLQIHFHANLGGCGCGARWDHGGSYATHLQYRLAKAVEEG
jgi:hypothetical protein